MLLTLSKARFAATLLKPVATAGKRLIFLLIALAFLALTPISSAHAKPLPPPDYLSPSSYIVRPRYLKPPLPPSGTKIDPCAYQQIDTNKYGGADFQNPREIPFENQVLQTALEVKYRQNTIAGCSVHLRSYDDENSLVGPTLRVKPGDTIKIQLSNHLPDDPSPPPPDINTPHGFNNTNFHTHGLHVDPGDSPDDISDNVLRTMAPRDEPYVIEVQIPKDHPGGTFWYHAHLHGSTALQVSSGMGGALIVEGGQDELLKNAEEKIFVLQQIAYDQSGKIEQYENIFGPDGWQKSKRQTTINGQIVPVIKMQPGEVQRWRFIHAGVRETVRLALRKSGSNAIIKLNEIAVDGIPLGQRDEWDLIELNPGYRSDVLVKAEETAEEYLLYDISSSAAKSLQGVAEAGQLLAKVEVSGDLKNMDLPSDKDLADIKAKEAPPDFTQLDIDRAGKQEVVFNIRLNDQGNPEGSINGKPYSDSEDNVRQLKLGAVDQWTLRTTAGSHPFHIHVNPFQIERIGPDGNTKEKIWKDTLLITKDQPVTMLTRYTDFTGEFVIHCHILDHEDQGMMQNVRITAAP